MLSGRWVERWEDARLGEPPPIAPEYQRTFAPNPQAVAIARKYLEKDELELMCQPAFRDRCGVYGDNG